MYELNKEKIREILRQEQVKAVSIESLLKHFPPLPDELGKLVETWMATRLVPDLVIDGISIHDVMQVRECHFLVALREMRKLLEPDLSTEERAQWRRILTTPVHFE